MPKASFGFIFTKIDSLHLITELLTVTQMWQNCSYRFLVRGLIRGIPLRGFTVDIVHLFCKCTRSTLFTNWDLRSIISGDITRPLLSAKGVSWFLESPIEPTNWGRHLYYKIH